MSRRQDPRVDQTKGGQEGTIRGDFKQLGDTQRVCKE